MGRPFDMRPLTRDQQRLVEQWTQLAYRAAHHFARQYPSLLSNVDDLKQAAVLGLIRAAQKWDPRRGVYFAHYAAPWIQVSLQRGGREILNVSSGSSSDEPNRIDHRDNEYDLTKTATRPRTSEELDGAMLLAAARDEIWLRDPKVSRYSERNADMFVRVEFGGESLQKVADSYGCSREYVRQVVQKTRAQFDAWASEVRAEAA